MIVVERESGEREEERKGWKEDGVVREEGDLCVKVNGKRGLKRYGAEGGEENVEVHGQGCDVFAQ